MNNESIQNFSNLLESSKDFDKAGEKPNIKEFKAHSITFYRQDQITLKLHYHHGGQGEKMHLEFLITEYFSSCV
ncbi:btb/poz domain-containing protein 19-like [Gigaspora margarita]|uniref:Btb/poz domain-containing protein 19-like n=1 Tax=Gigaspora margarita TaxID=4874 RepID=A0A8H4B3I1_GIGMA|nr:btb/poz domain-containing protein 19-like [Gigaspora margarita]